MFESWSTSDLAALFACSILEWLPLPIEPESSSTSIILGLELAVARTGVWASLPGAADTLFMHSISITASTPRKYGHRIARCLRCLIGTTGLVGTTGNA